MTRLTAFVLSAVFILTACGEQTIIELGPTDTPDPLAYYQPTPISPGRPDNPLPVVYVPPFPDAPQVAEAVTTLSSILSSRSGLSVEVQTAASHSTALADLCNVNDGNRFPAVWLNGPAAALAVAEGCGKPVLQATLNGESGIALEILASSGGAIGNLVGRNYCRFEDDSALVEYYGWALPVLAMQSNGIDPTRLGEVIDVPNRNLALNTISEGTCYALGAPAGYFSEDAGLLPIYTSPPIPLGVLFLPSEMLIADEAAFIQAYLDVVGITAEAVVIGDGTPTPEPEPSPTPVAGSDSEPINIFSDDFSTLNIPEERRALLWLSGADSLMPLAPEGLDEMRDFVAQAGFNLDNPNLR